MFQNFTHQIPCITMQQCSKKLINPIILTEYSPFSKSTYSISTKSSLPAENSTFFGQGHGQKVPLRTHQSMPFQVKKKFWGGGIAPCPDRSSGGKGYPLPIPHPNKPSGSAPCLPEFQPDLRHCVNDILRYTEDGRGSRVPTKLTVPSLPASASISVSL